MGRRPSGPLRDLRRRLPLGRSSSRRPILDRSHAAGDGLRPDRPDRGRRPAALVGSTAGSAVATSRELTPMSWQELRALADHGWEIGSHTGPAPAPHPDRRPIRSSPSSDRSKAAATRAHDPPCTSLAYPYGDVDPRVIAATARAGYSAAAGLPDGFIHRSPNWPRIGIYRADDDLRFRLKVSPVARWLRSSAAWDALERLRRLMRT